MTPYQELGLRPDASPAEIRAAHRVAAKLHHPDRGGDSDKFDRIQRAFAVLRDPEKRKAFDETGAWSEEPASTIEQQSLTAARNALMSVVMGAQDLAQIDVVAGALNYVKAQLDGLEIQRQQIERNLDRLGIARTRLRNMSEEPDVAAGLFDWQEQELRAALPKIEAQLRVQRAAEDVLKRYGYTFEMDGRPVSVSRDGRTMNVTFG